MSEPKKLPGMWAIRKTAAELDADLIELAIDGMDPRTLLERLDQAAILAHAIGRMLEAEVLARGCKFCKGRGRFDDHPCPKCHGTGADWGAI
jgi:hypothetical protein